jgi:hypothetical protein
VVGRQSTFTVSVNGVVAVEVSNTGIEIVPSPRVNRQGSTLRT